MGNTANRSWPYPESSDFVADGATAIENLADAIDGSIGAGRTLIARVFYLSSGTFTKASYPAATQVFITAVGGGGAGGGCTAVVDVGGGGGGSGGAVQLELPIASLAASETVTVGAGGAGAAGANGANGGDTTFGSHLTAGGGGGGLLDNGASNALPGGGGTASSTGLNLAGDAGGPHSYWGTTNFYGIGGKGGSAPLGGGGGRGQSNANGTDGSRGGGGGGGGNAAATTARAGGDGGNGYVLVEVWA